MKRFGKIQNLPSVKDVELVVRPYKTRTAFAASSTIYLNEHLIDNEEIVEYLILREMICIKLNMYRSRYSGLTYAAKFDSILHFFMPKEKVEEIMEKMEKLIEVNRRLRQPLFPLFYGAFRRRLVLRGWGEELLRRDNVDKRKRKKRGLFACRYIPRDSLTGITTPVRKNLQGSTCRCWLLRPFRHTAGRPLRSVPRGIYWQV